MPVPYMSTWSIVPFRDHDLITVPFESLFWFLIRLRSHNQTCTSLGIRYLCPELVYFKEGQRQKKRRKLLLLFGGQNLFNSFPRYIFCVLYDLY